MKARLSTFLAVLLFTLLSPFPAPPALASDEEAELKAVQQRIDHAQKELEAVRRKHKVAGNRLADTEREIGRVTRKLKELARSLKTQARQLEQYKRQRAEQEAGMEQLRASLARQLRAAYAMGREARLKLLLNQQDPAALGRLLRYHDYIQQARNRHILAIREKLQGIDRLIARIAEGTRNLTRMREEQRAEKRRLERQRDERAILVAAARRQEQEKGRELERLRRDEAELTRLVKNLQAALVNLPGVEKIPFHKLKGRLPMPVKGKIRHRYGSRRGNQGALWRGLLIQAKRGSEIRAVSHGRVVFADWLPGMGLLTIVDHGEGYMTLYGHSESLYMQPGAWVEAGTPIASVGDSGGQDRPGLYFEIRHNGKPTNPAKWFKS
jgi:septal ring factor EnvC (AmiA/AmiB activator)